MRRLKIKLEYDGSAYAGWQSQANATAIQDIVETALAEMTGEKVRIQGASRTDAGVHALGQVAAFNSGRQIPREGFIKGLNSLLPKDIVLLDCEEVSPEFHPVRDARRKTYHYWIETAEVPPALDRLRVAWVGRPLRLPAMERAAAYLLGEHDFKSFQGAGGKVRTTVRRLEKINLAEEGSRIRMEFVGNGFLRQMVRNIVGTFLEIGAGKRDPADMKVILEARDRRLAGPTAPPQGLYLVEVEYY